MYYSSWFSLILVKSLVAVLTLVFCVLLPTIDLILPRTWLPELRRDCEIVDSLCPRTPFVAKRQKWEILLLTIPCQHQQLTYRGPTSLNHTAPLCTPQHPPPPIAAKPVLRHTVRKLNPPVLKMATHPIAKRNTNHNNSILSKPKFVHIDKMLVR